MTWDRRSGTPHRAHNAVNQLTSRNIDLPASVAAAADLLARIQADHPTAPDTTAIRHAIVDGAARSEIDSLLLAELAFTRLRSEHSQAVVIAAERVLAAVVSERDSLHAALKVQAEGAIAHLQQVAALDGASLEELVRAGRHDAAQALAEVERVGLELASLYETRDSYLTPGGIESARAGHFDASQYRDPRIADRHNNPDLGVAGNYVHALRHGAQLWFPTSEQALAAAAPLYSRWEADAERVAAKQRQHGGTAAFI